MAGFCVIFFELFPRVLKNKGFERYLQQQRCCFNSPFSESFSVLNWSVTISHLAATDISPSPGNQWKPQWSAHSTWPNCITKLMIMWTHWWTTAVALFRGIYHIYHIFPSFLRWPMTPCFFRNRLNRLGIFSPRRSRRSPRKPGHGWRSDVVAGRVLGGDRERSGPAPSIKIGALPWGPGIGPWIPWYFHGDLSKMMGWSDDGNLGESADLFNPDFIQPR